MSYLFQRKRQSSNSRNIAAPKVGSASRELLWLSFVAAAVVSRAGHPRSHNPLMTGVPRVRAIIGPKHRFMAAVERRGACSQRILRYAWRAAYQYIINEMAKVSKNNSIQNRTPIKAIIHAEMRNRRIVRAANHQHEIISPSSSSGSRGSSAPVTHGEIKRLC